MGPLWALNEPLMGVLREPQSPFWGVLSVLWTIRFFYGQKCRFVSCYVFVKALAVSTSALTACLLA